MAVRITPRLIELTYESLLRSFWRREALKKFLRASHLSNSALSNWPQEESKRVFLDRIFQQLQSSETGKAAICQMARSLSEQSTFPDLRNWEDSELKIQGATKAVAELKAYLAAQDEEIRSERDREEVRRKAHEDRQKIQKTLTDKASLQRRLESLHSEVGTQDGGYRFQEWFYDLLDYCEIQNRRPFVTGGRQIDGSLTLDGTTYIVELKFTKSQSDATDIDSLRAKVEDKDDNTMGIMFSVSGYSRVAIAQASGRKTALLLFDASHLYLFLRGAMSFSEILNRVRRHASQTGEAHLAVPKFDG